MERKIQNSSIANNQSTAEETNLLNNSESAIQDGIGTIYVQL